MVYRYLPFNPLVALYTNGYGAIHWGMGNLPIATSHSYRKRAPPAATLTANSSSARVWASGPLFSSTLAFKTETILCRTIQVTTTVVRSCV